MQKSQHAVRNQQIALDHDSTPFFAKYIPRDIARTLLDDDRLVAIVDFVLPEKSSFHCDDPRWLTIALDELGDTDMVEAWFSREPARVGCAGQINYCFNDDFLFGQLRLEESDYKDLEALGCASYRQIVQLLNEINYPHILRTWNFFPAITDIQNKMERYQTFCAGRYGVLSRQPEFERKLPAASAIGTCSPSAEIYFVAARESGTQVENPRQVSAFHYPRQYGPRSPSFSRAVSKRWSSGHHVYISGTASVVGHETKHLKDTPKQTEETLRNIESLIQNLPAEHHCALKSINDLSLLKVYVRHKHDFGIVKQHIDETTNGSVPILYLHGDICRSDLLIEIEGLYFSAD